MLRRMAGVIIGLMGLILVVGAAYSAVHFVGRLYFEDIAVQNYSNFFIPSDSPYEIVGIGLLGGLVFVLGCFTLVSKTKRSE